MTKEWYSVTNSDRAVDISIYGDIGSSWWGDSVSAKQLLDQISAAKGKPINLRINSGGGNVFDAFAMMSALHAHDGKVTAYVDGNACSAASFLLAAADEIVIASVGWVMIHNAAAMCAGEAADLRHCADLVEKITDQLAGIYAKRGNLTEAEFAEAMQATTWYTAEEAVAVGLADRIEEVVAVAACLTQDQATLASAPASAQIVNSESAPAAPEKTTPSDTLPIIPSNDNGDDPEVTPADAQERIVVIDSKIYRIKEKPNA